MVVPSGNKIKASGETTVVGLLFIHAYVFDCFFLFLYFGRRQSDFPFSYFFLYIGGWDLGLFYYFTLRVVGVDR